MNRPDALLGDEHGEVLPPVAGTTQLLQALGDPVRMELVRALAGAAGPITCGAFQVPVTKSTLTHHFRVLREAGVIETRCLGTRKLISLRRPDVDQAYPGLLASLLRAPAEPVLDAGWAAASSR